MVRERSREHQEVQGDIEKRKSNTYRALSMLKLVLGMFQIDVATEGDMALVCACMVKNRSRPGVLWCLKVFSESLRNSIVSEGVHKRLLQERQKVWRDYKKMEKQGKGHECEDLKKACQRLLKVSQWKLTKSNSGRLVLVGYVASSSEYPHLQWRVQSGI